MWTYNYTCANELYHHGIKGMKWGVRRFQYKDGSLTGAGRKRYGSDVSEKRAEYKKAHRDYRNALGASMRYSDRYFISRKTNKRVRAEDERLRSEAEKKRIANEAAKKAYEEARNTPEAKAERARKTKKAIKVGAAVAGTALAAYGAYKLNKYVKEKNVQIEAKRGREYAEKNLHQTLKAMNAMGMKSDNVYLSSNSGYKALERANAASNDSFAKAAKNVISYKRQGGKLKELAPLGMYKNDLRGLYYESARGRR